MLNFESCPLALRDRTTGIKIIYTLSTKPTLIYNVSAFCYRCFITYNKLNLR